LEENRRSETARGYVYAILGALCGGSVTTLAKLLLSDNGPVVVTGLPYLLSGLILLLYQPRRKPQRASLGYLLFFGLIGAIVAPLMYFTGLNETTAVNAALLANGEVLFTILLAYSVFGERLSRGQTGRGLLIVVGLVIISTNLDVTNFAFFKGLAGNLLVLGSTLAWGVENNLIAVATKRFDASLLSKFRNLIGGGVLTLFILAAGSPLVFGYRDVLFLVLLALAIAGGTYLFIAATKRLGAIKMLLVWSSSTVFGAVFALIFLGEQITLAQVLGGVLILSGVYLFHRGERIPAAESPPPPAGVAAE
jgi:drug/metabolite transporter (DMT)-like permease